MKNKYKIALVVIALCLSITFLFGTSYALWQVNKVQEGENKLVSGCFEMEFQYENVISLNNDYPMSDANGMKKTPYRMTVKNTCNIAAKLNIVMNVFNDSTMDASKMKLAMSGEKTLSPTLVSALTQTTPVGNNASNAKIAYALGSDHLEPQQTKTYEFKLWIDEQAGNDVMNQVFKADFVIEAAATTSGENAVEKLTELAKSNTTEMFTDDTADANIRYMGANPNNYVDIGNGNDADGNPILWRIIGVMNNVNDGTGKKETRVKLIREKSIGNLNWGSDNNWTTASLNTLLNNDYFNKMGDYSTTGFQIIDNNLLGDAVYYLGGPSYSNDNASTAKQFYDIERSTAVYSGNSTTWTGKVGLMYPSDYGYATSGGTTTSKEMCATEALSNWYKYGEESRYSDCKNNDWLFDSNDSQWTISPHVDHNLYAMVVNSTGFVTGDYVFDVAAGGYYASRPVIYLKSNAKFVGAGDGTKENPYKLGI